MTEQETSAENPVEPAAAEPATAPESRPDFPQETAIDESAVADAVSAIRDGKLVVLPTDTVYGIGADAFNADAVGDLLAAKGRGRDVPPPVLVGDIAVLMALATDVPEDAERLAEEFWPGPLTLILTAQPSLHWDLGETRGTVALRMPDHPTALHLLQQTGPLAVSSANRHGRSAAITVLEAATQLGDSVEVYLDGGKASLGSASTIIDMTVTPPEIVRDGALSKEEIIERLGDIFAAPEPESMTESEVETSEDADSHEQLDADAAAGTDTNGEPVTDSEPAFDTREEPAPAAVRAAEASTPEASTPEASTPESSVAEAPAADSLTPDPSNPEQSDPDPSDNQLTDSVNDAAPDSTLPLNSALNLPQESELRDLADRDQAPTIEPGSTETEHE